MRVTTMAYDVPSREKVKKAGKVLINIDATADEFEQAMAVMSQWRSLHSYPINTFQAMLRGKVKRLGFKSPIIAQRLKRAPSIVRKLTRFPSMSLSRMQDIGGIRIVLPTVNDVYRLHDDIVKSKGRFEHEALLPPYDYIQLPKPDGYRSLHQIFKYKNMKMPELDGLFIELQIRTKLQHSWATAVETLGLVEKSSFKTGEGAEEFKHFFKLASALFAHHEKQPIIDELASKAINELADELMTLEQELQIYAKLKGLIVTAKHIETSSSKSDEYHLMELDTSKDSPAVSLIPFTKSQLDIAESLYKMREIATQHTPNIEVVLIAAGNLKDIKKAYPNYFLDTQDFIKNLKNICHKLSK